MVAGGGSVPANNVGAGNLAGMGIGPKGEPGVPVSVQKRRYRKTKSPILFPDMMRRTEPNNIKEECGDSFAGSTVFKVPSNLFHNLRWEKRKGKHWKKYLEEDDCFAEIREFAIRNKKIGIILQNERSGEMMYARYPRKKG